MDRSLQKSTFCQVSAESWIQERYPEQNCLAHSWSSSLASWGEIESGEMVTGRKLCAHRMGPGDHMSPEGQESVGKVTFL